ncbi:MAG: hypothetical protein WC264_01100 [Candidatus Paceibacterota bacterium]|jgi:hypothetical protein
MTAILIIVIISSVLIIRFLGSTVFFWCIPIAILGVLIAFFYPIFRDEGWVPDASKLPKKIWKRYLKWESKFFKWLDRYF